MTYCILLVKNEALEVIQSSTASRFNFTSIFADDSAGDEEPIFPAIETQQPETQKPSKEGYIVYQTALHYNYAPQGVYPTQQKEYGNEDYGTAGYGHNQRNYGKSPQNPNSHNFGQKTYDQSNDRSYGRNDDTSSNNNPNYAQNSGKSYDHSSNHNVGQHIDSHIVSKQGRDAIGQVDISKTNTKVKSSRSRPHYRSPVERGFALTSGQRHPKRGSTNNNNGSKGGKDGTKGATEDVKGGKGSKPVVKGSPSTVNKQRSVLRKNPELNVNPNVNAHNFNQNPWRPIFRKRSTVDTNITEPIKHIAETAEASSDANELERPKRQTEDGEEICRTRKMYITPKAALNDKSEWKYIINLGDKDPQLKQVIKVDVCVSPGEPCSNQIQLPFGFVSRCKQKYLKKKLLSLDADGEGTSTENFFVPSCCVCEIIRPNKRK
ncbi:uncharacterized protein B4U80_02444 [Leptotrombidium deliense]|uniref:Spaetzle domain-containing protein n=1 Tax=Leptotrombidium deliense TaxID=299467 RepID=A0A443STA4_9ACAR|nr:uncharacterized protein B4U80_02444 [Leptotrombidium deliense]